MHFCYWPAGEMKTTLRHGYTTGACAAAAAKGAAQMLRRQQMLDSVEISLPRGERVPFSLHGQDFDAFSASCFVVKDAGDDPDVTNGAEIHVSIRRNASRRPGGGTMVFVSGGAGIGRVTKPGLAVAVGDWAINPVPLRMITEAVMEEFSLACLPETLYVKVSIPDGEERARKTLNARLGIIGGLSILGTTGIVKPLSAQAWTDTIDAAIDVAIACGSRTVVLSTGRTSEQIAQGKLQLQEEAFVMMGDHVGHALRASSRKGVREVVMACQFAKLVKIACGHEQTHVSSAELDIATLAGWLDLDPGAAVFGSLLKRVNTARQLLDESGNDPELINLVVCRAKSFAKQLAPDVRVKVLLAGYDSTVVYFA